MIEPVLREKKRYVIFEVEKKMDYDTIKEKIFKEALTFLGQKGTGEAGLILLPELWNGRRGVIRVKHNMVNELKVVLGLIKGCKIKPLKTTGTLKKAKKIMEEI